MQEIYKRYRPKKLEDVVGQKLAVRCLSVFLAQKQLPHTLMLTGPSGVGKTTIARILKRELGCSNSDFYEINAANTRGIDTVREIQQKMSLSPLRGECKMWLLDEVHHLTKREGGDAQTALLKILEDTPPHVYFILATTDPDKLRVTIRTRCTEVRLSAISDDELKTLVHDTWSAETNMDHDPNWEVVIDKIVETAEGSARKALVILGEVIGLETEEEMLAAITPPEAKRQAWDLVKALLYERTKWADVVKIIQQVDLSEPEKFRHLVLACARTTMLKANKQAPRAYAIAETFSSPWYDCPETGLLVAAYEICQRS